MIYQPRDHLLENDPWRDRSSIYSSAIEKTRILKNTSSCIEWTWGIPFIMITKQGSLSIIKRISKNEGCTYYRLGRTHVSCISVRISWLIHARNSRHDSHYRRRRGKIIIKRSSHVEKLKFQAANTRYSYRREISLYCNVCNITSVHIWNYCSPYLVRFS